MTHPCPRMAEMGHGPGSRFKLPTKSHWRDDHSCSFCGGLDPNEAFRLLEDGARISTTNKDYKIYLRHEDVPTPSGKVYFQHFDREDRQRFVRMLNDKRLKFVEVGGQELWFNPLPFFITYDKADAG